MGMRLLCSLNLGHQIGLKTGVGSELAFVGLCDTNDYAWDGLLLKRIGNMVPLAYREYIPDYNFRVI